MAYTVFNHSQETIFWDVKQDGQTIWTSERLAPGEQQTAEHLGSYGIAELLTIQVPQHDPHGNPHGTMGWGSVLVYRDGCVTVYGNWSFDVRRSCDHPTDESKA
jgi:hypothetical protein